jgi:O-Antigen ligase
MTASIDTILRRLLTYGTATILVLMPLHAFLTVWLSSAIGNYTALRLWKESLLVVLVGAAVLLVYRQPQLFRRALWRKSIRLLGMYGGAYALLTLTLGLVAYGAGRVDAQALGYGYISNLRFVMFFAVCFIAGVYYRRFWLAHWQKLLLYPAIAVLVLGLLQLLVLPPDILRHFGYGPNTIAPFIAVDQKVEFARAQSTLRGPNPLGAYLVIICAAIVALYARTKHYLLKFGILVSLMVLFGTYSRSAWIGAIVALFGLGCMLLDTKARQILLGATGLFIAMGVFGIVLLQDNNTVQNIVFHTDETSQASRSSNEDRAGAITGGLGDIMSEPFGRGVGTAGPASVYNNGSVRISENYFIQVGQEVGIIGLVLFVAICSLAGKVLWDIRDKNTLPGILLMSLIGLTLVNILSHVWADDTLAYIWWGFAGLCTGMYVLAPGKAKRP